MGLGKHKVNWHSRVGWRLMNHDDIGVLRSAWRLTLPYPSTSYSATLSHFCPGGCCISTLDWQLRHAYLLLFSLLANETAVNIFFFRGSSLHLFISSLASISMSTLWSVLHWLWFAGEMKGFIFWFVVKFVVYSVCSLQLYIVTWGEPICYYKVINANLGDHPWMAGACYNSSQAEKRNAHKKKRDFGVLATDLASCWILLI